jgi:hypothetical protein
MPCPLAGKLYGCIRNETPEALTMQNPMTLPDNQGTVITEFMRTDTEVTGQFILTKYARTYPIQRRFNMDLKPVCIPSAIFQKPRDGACRASTL